MARSSKTDGKRRSAATTRKARSAKSRDPKTQSQKDQSGSKRASRTKPSTTDLKKQIERQARELEEARQERAASSIVLHIIGASPGALTPVFQAIVKNAVELCGAHFGAAFKMEGNLLHLVADYNFGATQRQLLGAMYPMVPNRGHISGRAVLTGAVVQIADIYDDTDYKSVEAKKAGFRSLLAVPLLQKGQAIGSIVIYRTEPGTFTTRQSAILQSFADQAVIAIENTRLFNETKEALERQTATADILKVIASSPSDVQPVFEAIVASANRLLGGFSATVYRFIDGQAHLQAFTPTTPEADDILKSTFPLPLDRFAPFEMAQAGEGGQIADTETLTGEILAIARARGFRSMLFAPLMNKGTSIGIVAVTRVAPGTFADHHVQLLKTFADQAVIAVENVRLFDEVQAKTADLEESLQQQTATADVLKVISRSAFDLQAVLDTLVESAARLCEANHGIIVRPKDDVHQVAASWGLPPEKRAYFEGRQFVPGENSVAGRALLEGRVIHIEDVFERPEYVLAGDPDPVRTRLAVPLLREGRPIGVFVLTRQQVNPFTDKQIELVQTFADQAVIAIENTRLFEQVQAKTARPGRVAAAADRDRRRA
jgi:GAF domain-containing protein